MKKLIVFIGIFFLSLGLKAQTVMRDSNGNFYAVTITKKVFTDTNTKWQYTHSDRKIYPVYVSKNGKYYSWIISKNGNMYRKYHN